MNQSFESLLTWMDSHSHEVPLEDLMQRLGVVDVELDDLKEFERYGDLRYQRNLIKAGEGYHALLLCWKPGQRSPIHDHRGSACAVRVLSGICTETQFERTEQGDVYPTFTRQLYAGQVCGSYDHDMHQISNLSSHDPLVTIHIYTPPLLVMGQYSLTERSIGEFLDPVLQFADGAGI